MLLVVVISAWEGGSGAVDSMVFSECEWDYDPFQRIQLSFLSLILVFDFIFLPMIVSEK